MPYLQQHFSGAGTGWLCLPGGAQSSRPSTYSRFVTCPSKAPCSLWLGLYVYLIPSSKKHSHESHSAVVISYRTSSSFERYNEGRRYWSTIVYNSRTFARTVWFHVPDIATTDGADDAEKRARTLVEKKTVLNLVEGFA